MSECCLGCQFSHPKPGLADVLLCRRYPPQVYSDAESVSTERFPLVASDDYCGEYRWRETYEEKMDKAFRDLERSVRG